MNKYACGNYNPFLDFLSFGGLIYTLLTNFQNNTIMIHYMNTYNAHNKELVEKINEVCNDEKLMPNVIIAVRAICDLCGDECRTKIGFVPYFELDIRSNLSDILMWICDDTDLEIILKFCRK